MSRQVAVASVLAMVALGVAACHDTGQKAVATPSPTSGVTATLPPPSPGPYVTTGRGPEPPATNAWFGAYADPLNTTAAEKLSALAAFQTLIGRKLAIVHSFHPWTDTVPSAIDYDIVQNGQIDLMSWAGTDTISLASGVYDSQIKQTATAIRDMHAPILLRFRWEMDRPNLASVVHSPKDFIAAWKHVRAIFTQVGALNAGFVWCPLATGFANGTAPQYYPGDDQVDWICADVYPTEPSQTFASMMAPVMQFAKAHPRPLIIGEFGVESEPNSARATWFNSVIADLKSQPQIKAIVYFNSDERVKPFANYLLDKTPGDLSAFRNLADNPYLDAGP